MAPTDEQAWAEAEGPYKDFLGYADRLRRAQSGNDPGGRSPFDLDADLRDSALFGSPDTVLGRLREIHELGIDRVMLFLHMGGLPHEKIMSSLDLLAREVLPVVRGVVSMTSPVVDAQVHVWLPEGPDRPWPPGGAERAPSMHRHEPISGATLLAEMKEAGVDRAVLVPPFFEGYRNDYAVACATEAPGPSG